MASERQGRVTREEARRILRRLELEAYSAIVTAFRAQGDLSKTKKGFLQELGSFLCISTERHRAEVRRVVNDDRLSGIAECIHGYDTGTDWTMEGRRLVSLMPRLVPQTALTAKATANANSAAASNARVTAARLADLKNAAASKEAEKDAGKDAEVTAADGHSFKRDENPKPKKRKKNLALGYNKNSSMANHVLLPPKIVSGSMAGAKGTMAAAKVIPSQTKFHTKPIILQRNTVAKSIRVEPTYMSSTPLAGAGTSNKALTSAGGVGPMMASSENAQLNIDISNLSDRLQLSPKSGFKSPLSRQRQQRVFHTKAGGVTSSAEAHNRQMLSLASGFTSPLDGMGILMPPQSIPMAPISPVKTEAMPMSPLSSQQLSGTVRLIQLPKSLSGSMSPRSVLQTTKLSPMPSVETATNKSPAQRMLTLSSVAASLSQHGKVSMNSQSSATIAQGPKLVSVTKSVPVAAGFKMIAVTTIVAGTTQVRTVYIATPIMSLTKTISQMTSNVITTPAAITVDKASVPLPASITLPKLSQNMTMQKLMTNLTGVSMPNLITGLAGGIFTPTVTCSPPVPLTAVPSNVTPSVMVCSSTISSVLTMCGTTPSLETMPRVTACLPLNVLKGGLMASPGQSSLVSSEITAIQKELAFVAEPVKEVRTVDATMLLNKNTLPGGAISHAAVATCSPSHLLSDVISTINSTQLLSSASVASTRPTAVSLSSRPDSIVHCSPSLPGPRSQVVCSSVYPRVIPIADNTLSAPPDMPKQEDDSILSAGEKFLQMLTQRFSGPSTLSGSDMSVPNVVSKVVPPTKGAHVSPVAAVSIAVPTSDFKVATPHVKDPVVAMQMDLSTTESLSISPDRLVHTAAAVAVPLPHVPEVVANHNVTTVDGYACASAKIQVVNSIVPHMLPPRALTSGSVTVSNNKPCTDSPPSCAASATMAPVVVTGCIAVDEASLTSSASSSSCPDMGDLKFVRLPPSNNSAEHEAACNKKNDATVGNSHVETDSPPKISLANNRLPVHSQGNTTDRVSDGIMLAIKEETFQSPSCDSQNNEVLIASNGRKRKGQGETSPRQLQGWIRGAVLLLQKVSRYRGSHKTKGELNAAAWFTRPVDPKDAPGYLKLIRHPMDFGTVRKKLETGQYKEFSEFFDDMQLVKTNCHTYNPPEHMARKDCDVVFEYFETEYKKLLERWHRCHVSPSKKQKLITTEPAPVETEP